MRVKADAKKRQRNIYFCAGYCHFWKTPIMRLIEKLLKTKHPKLHWLRVRMSHHRYSNLKEMFSSDLTSKVMKNVFSLDFHNKKDCNCGKAKNKDGNCIYNGKCLRTCLIYKVTCLKSGKIYIGNTQQSLKDRMKGHFQDVQYLIRNNKKADSFASHFAQFFKSEPKPADLREIMNVEILSLLNPFSCVKQFQQPSCRLCMVERITIITEMRKNRKAMINANSEIFGACRHRTRFHRYRPDDPQGEKSKA